MGSTESASGAGKRLLLIDGSALLYRSYFAFIRNPLRNSKGEPTSAAFGVLNTLVPILEEHRPDRLAVVFDTAAPTFRHREYAEYKAHRPPIPEELVVQIPRVRALLTALGIPLLEQQGVEADDLIGSLAREAERAGCEVWILTGDKDFFQLVSDRIRLLTPRGRGDQHVHVDRDAVRERYGVGPERMVDLLALMGDASDNVPGVPGVGEKTAAHLIETYGSLDDIYRSLDRVERPSLREKLRTNEGKARLSRKLVTIRADLPLDRHWDELLRERPDRAELLRILDELELRGLRKRFATELPDAPGELFGGAGKPRAGDGRPAAERAAPASGARQDPAAGDLFGGTEVTRSRRAPLGDYHVVDSPRALERLVAALSEARGWVAFDTETTGLDPRAADLVGISLALRAGEAFYLPLGHEEGPNLEPDAVRRALAPFFASPDAKRVAQNAKFDWHVLDRFGVEVRDVAFDTMIAAYLVEPEQPKNVDRLARTRLGVEKIPTEALIGARGGKQVSMASLPVTRVGEYCCEDADVCLRLVPLLSQELESAGLTALYEEVEVPLIGVLQRMERTGVRVEVEALDGMSRDLAERLGTLEAQIQEAAGVPFNVNSTRQVAEVLFDRIGLKPGRRTKEGFSTDVEVLERLADEHPLPRLLLEYRQYQKLKSTYLDALPRLADPATGRIHATFHQAVAATGRLTVSDPNLQNIPIRTGEGARIRRAFAAEGPRGRLASFDYSQVELRLLAHLSGDPVLAEAFRQGEDVHRTTAARLFGIAPEEVSAAQRAQAKVVNFGVLYGMGPVRLARELGLSRALATAFIEEHRRTLTGVSEYLDGVLELARERGYAETILHRKRPLPGLRAEEAVRRAEAERAAVNTPIQGSAADLIKVAMVRIDRLLSERGWKSRLILQVHDELLFETDEEELPALVPAVREAMEHALPLRVPLLVNVGAGRTWGEAHV
jgi:DNA polymerase-1